MNIEDFNNLVKRVEKLENAHHNSDLVDYVCGPKSCGSGEEHSKNNSTLETTPNNRCESKLELLKGIYGFYLEVSTKLDGVLISKRMLVTELDCSAQLRNNLISDMVKLSLGKTTWGEFTYVWREFISHLR